MSVVERMPGEEAGLKSVELEVSGRQVKDGQGMSRQGVVVGKDGNMQSKGRIHA